MAAYVLAGLWAGYRLVRKFQPDVIHAHFAVPAGALAWMLSRLTHIPYVLTAHLGDVPGGVPEKTAGWFRWIFPFTRPIWQKAESVVAVSEFTRLLALPHYPVKIRVIPNGVDVDALRPELIRVNDPPQIVFAGRFMPQKAPLQVIRVLAELKDSPWQCAMIGDGPLMADVKREIMEYGLEDRITLPGWIDPQQVLGWFDRSDILFMPSLSEGFPVVGVQALAKGLAIVASRVGGLVDLVDHDRNGCLIEQDALSHFTACLRGLLSDPNRLLAYRKASLEKAADFDIHHIAQQYHEIFLDVVNDH